VSLTAQRVTSRPNLATLARKPRPVALVQPAPAPRRAQPARGLVADPLGRVDLFDRVSPGARADLVAQMQRTQGNLHVQRFLAGSRPPAQVRVQRCGATPCNCSPQERAAHAMEELPGAAQRFPELDLAGAIQRSTGGEPLHPIARAKLEPAMGLDLGHVAVHHDRGADELARAVDAEAFTTGDHIFFREGRYDPHSTGGLRLLAHEITHTVQQARGAVSGVQHFGGVQVNEPGDGHEQEAEQAADAAIARMAAPPASAPPAPQSWGVTRGGRSSPPRIGGPGGPKVIQRSFQQDVSPGFTAKWTPFARVAGPPFDQTTNFDRDGFHDEFNVPPKSQGRLILLADVEWTAGGGQGPNPQPKPDDPSAICKFLITITKPVPLLNQAITFGCKNGDPAAVIDSLNDAQLCALAALLGLGVGGVICAALIAAGAAETIRNAIKDLLGIPRTKPNPQPNPGPNPGPNPTPVGASTGKGRATIETRFFVGIDGKIQTVGLPPRIEANGTGAELASPVDFIRTDIPGGVNIAFQPMIKGTTPGETHVFQHQWDIDLKQPAPPAPLPFSFGLRMFPFKTGKEFFEDEQTQQTRLFKWFQTMDPRVRSRIIAGQLQVVVQGFASHLGDPAFNLTLSEKRAKRIEQMIHDFGGQFANVNTFAFGEVLAGGGPKDNSPEFRSGTSRTCGQLEGADAAAGPMKEPDENDPSICPSTSAPAPAVDGGATPDTGTIELG
jgi:hypothetical protein